MKTRGKEKKVIHYQKKQYNLTTCIVAIISDQVIIS